MLSFRMRTGHRRLRVAAKRAGLRAEFPRGIWMCWSVLCAVVLLAGPVVGQDEQAVPQAAGQDQGAVVERVVQVVRILAGQAEAQDEVRAEVLILPGGQPVKVEVEADHGSADPAPPANPDDELRKKLADKLAERVNVRLNNVSLQEALEKLAKDHEFEFRIDAGGLRAAQIDPAKVQVGINVRKRTLSGVLREILTGHKLRFALDKNVVVVTNRAPQPSGIKKRKVADNAPVERIVLGNLVVSDKADEVEAKERRQAVAEAQVMVRNGPALDPAAAKQMRDQQRQQFQQQFSLALRTELTLGLSTSNPTPEQRGAITQAAKQAFNAAAEKWIDIQVQMMRGWNGQPPKYPNVRDEVQQAILAEIQKLQSPEAVDRYKREVDARSEHRRQTTIRNLVSTIDRSVVLSAQQREKLAENMRKHWQPTWGNALEYMQWEGNNVFPNMPADCLDSVLNDTQRKVWAAVPKMDPSQFWGGGGGFGFFNAAVAVEAVEGAIEVGVAVEQAIEGEPMPAEARPAPAENPAP